MTLELTVWEEAYIYIYIYIYIYKTQNKGKENSYQELKRSPKERHMQTYRNLIEIFRRSQTFSQSEESECKWTHDKDASLESAEFWDPKRKNLNTFDLCQMTFNISQTRSKISGILIEN